MIQYRKSDGMLGDFNSDKLYKIEVVDHKFKVTLKHIGWDDYDFWYEEINDIIELRI